MSNTASILETIYIFFAWLGEGILRFPNKAFYVVIVIMSILAPIFAIVMVIALLCGVYRRCAIEF